MGRYLFRPAHWTERTLVRGSTGKRSGVAQWQSSRLLTDWLWVRVPPPEYFLQQPRL
jgi:hypothetical protein